MGHSGRKLLVLALVALAGCGVSEDKFESSREVLAGSPAARNAFISNCVERMKSKPAQQRAQLAAIINTSVRNMPGSYCQRVTRGIVNGRITREDLNKSMGGNVTPSVIRVLQGR
ncbi:hypothetical protein [Paracoccus pacificus]|uniref:Lipoprotein n=1 Tax=Paracoccus pacificus TaxID=1463598 RepID=A0ABW4RAM8_9RHOB